MESDGKLAQWAALFVRACSEDKAAASAAGRLAPASGVHYSGVTESACELLRAVDSGGVPAFVTGNLKQIAQDNGVELSGEWTPNEIVDAIRSKARASAAGDGGTAD
jgi:hypothetical protein